MTGTLAYFFKGIAPDTDIPPATPDELKLTITLVYEGWAPLAKVRSARAITRKQLNNSCIFKEDYSCQTKVLKGLVPINDSVACV